MRIITTRHMFAYKVSYGKCLYKSLLAAHSAYSCPTYMYVPLFCHKNKNIIDVWFSFLFM